MARDGEVWRQTYSRGKATSKLKKLGAAGRGQRGTTVTFIPDPDIFGKAASFKAKTLYQMVRAKAYLIKDVELRWKCAAKLLPGDASVPETETIHFERGIEQYLEEALAGRPTYTLKTFAGTHKLEGEGRLEWAVAWPVARPLWGAPWARRAAYPGAAGVGDPAGAGVTRRPMRRRRARRGVAALAGPATLAGARVRAGRLATGAPHSGRASPAADAAIAGSGLIESGDPRRAGDRPAVDPFAGIACDDTLSVAHDTRLRQRVGWWLQRLQSTVHHKACECGALAAARRDPDLPDRECGSRRKQEEQHDQGHDCSRVRRREQEPTDPCRQEWGGLLHGTFASERESAASRWRPWTKWITKCCCRAENPKLSFRGKQRIAVDYFGEPTYVFPRRDCVMLPIPNSTAEMLAQYLGTRVRDELESWATGT